MMCWFASFWLFRCLYVLHHARTESATRGQTIPWTPNSSTRTRLLLLRYFLDVLYRYIVRMMHVLLLRTFVMLFVLVSSFVFPSLFFSSPFWVRTSVHVLSDDHELIHSWWIRECPMCNNRFDLLVSMTLGSLWLQYKKRVLCKVLPVATNY